MQPLDCTLKTERNKKVAKFLKNLFCQRKKRSEERFSNLQDKFETMSNRVIAPIRRELFRGLPFQSGLVNL
jgi:hypothetical protein